MKKDNGLVAEFGVASDLIKAIHPDDTVYPCL